MTIPSIVEDALKAGVLSLEQEAAIYSILHNHPCTEADLNALEVLLDKLGHFPDSADSRPQATG
ncbi:hypothetical protein [Synechococcus sp. W55.2]|jgi:hypothetical protein|uniref:hypothetical protein n=1 Tax=unclassified Synechococcus TaxID=2626047 RepID=UPI0039C329B1